MNILIPLIGIICGIVMFTVFGPITTMASMILFSVIIISSITINYIERK